MATLFRQQLFLPLEARHLSLRPPLKLCARGFAIAAPSKVYDAVVVGAGPGGLTAASSLLDEGLKVCMIDPSFTAGRINEKYREVPSNTKVKMFAQWATATKAFSKVIEAAPEDNPYAKMMTFDQDQGCVLGDAIEVAQMLSDGLRADERVATIQGRATKVKFREGKWVFPEHDIASKNVVLAQGSHPSQWPRVLKNKAFRHIKKIDLDTCLKPSELRNVVSAGDVVAVVGSSHSAVLAMKNLYEIDGVKILNFYRSPLLYAEYKDDWILYDNTGLKGIAADWAKEVLEHPADPERLRRLNTREQRSNHPGQSEYQMYQRELEGCTHIVAAVGYTRNDRPDIGGITYPGPQGGGAPRFDPYTGRFKKTLEPDAEIIAGLYGVGIAYPETVTDRVGNVEQAVGWFKFMTFMKRVVPEWTKSV